MKKNTVTASAHYLILFISAAAILQGCALFSAKIELTEKSENARITGFNLISETLLFDDGVTRIHNFRAVSKVSDKEFIVGLRQEPTKGLLMSYNEGLTTNWSVHFDMNENEYAPAVWYHNNRVAVLTHVDAQGIRSYIGRLFDAGNGQLQTTKDIIRVATESEGFDAGSTFYSYSPDSSHMLVVVNTGKFEACKDHRDMVEFRTRLIVVSHDLESIRRENVVVRVQDDPYGNTWPSFAINNRGDIFYTAYNVAQKDVGQMLVRLPAKGGNPDTLSITTSRMKYDDEGVFPANALIDVLTDDVISLSWQQGVGRQTACISVSRFDFASPTVLMSNNIVLGKEELEALIDDDELRDYRLLQCISLPDGCSLLVLDEERVGQAKVGQEASLAERSQIGSQTPAWKRNQIEGRQSRVIGTYAVAGPLIVLRLDAKGNTTWKSSLKKRRNNFTMGNSFENYPSMFLTDNSLRMVYRTRSDIQGITYMEFMLNNGEVRTAELPISYANYALFFPWATQWTHDGQAVIVGREGRIGQIIRLKLPPTKPLEQE